MMIPLIRRKFLLPLDCVRSGSPKHRYLKKLKKSQFLTGEQLIARQWARLKAIIDFSYSNTTFYRNHFNKAHFHPSDLRSTSDIKKIPILTKNDVRRQLNSMISREFELKNLLRYKTGGSTGEPLNLYITEKCSEMRNALALRNDCWSGWNIGEPIAAVWGNPDLPQTIKGKIKKKLLEPVIYLDTMRVNEKSIAKFESDWRKTKPTLLFGHAHSIFILSEYIRSMQIKTIHPKGIICSSMMLLPHERRQIENVFGVKVINRYGCEEVSLIASECEKHEGLHLNVEHLFIEFIRSDGQDAIPGESGSIIVTDLINKAMPFIRYQIEDSGVPADRRCSCGRGLPLMSEVTGRLADFLIKRDGTKIAGVSLIENTLTKIPGIQQMQIVQEKLELIVIHIVSLPSFKSENRQQLVRYFKTLFGADVEIQINIVNSIKPEKSGKYRFSKCRVNYHSLNDFS